MARRPSDLGLHCLCPYKSTPVLYGLNIWASNEALQGEGLCSFDP